MPDPAACPDCGTEFAPGLLTCPGCRRLVHAERLKRLAGEAEGAVDPAAALAAWRSALELLPPGSRQHAAVAARIADLGRQVDAAPATAPPSPQAGGAGVARAAGLGTIALLAWKLKAVAALAKGKFVLAGLAKLGTLSTMALSLGVYSTAFGWRLALGLVASIYLHEMGHVAALVRYGVRAGVPLFVPGVGAFIRVRQALGDPRQDARVGLAGPLWGLGAATASFVIALAVGSMTWAAIARLGAAINLFNLLPLGPLDGGRAFRALTRPQRWTAVLTIAAAWSLGTDPLTEGLLGLLLLGGLVAAPGRGAPTEPDRGVLLTYATLVVALGLLSGFAAPSLPR
ncbi:MAG TPA: site-2 protease family protein [Isosphaeraceae bacterium]|jgi:Zn-dependent protease|nr:site-2 protease family protein [Isosphaeraceae bacterium]